MQSPGRGQVESRRHDFAFARSRLDRPCRSIKEPNMSLQTILIIVLVVLLFGGGGWYYRGRR